MAVNITQIRTSIGSHKILLAYVIAVALYSLYQFYDPLNQLIGFGVMMIAPTMLVFAVVPWVVAAALVVSIAIVYWLAGIRNNILAAALSFSVSYIVISLLAAITELPAYAEIIGGALLALVIFAGISHFVSKFALPLVQAVIISAVCLGVSLYAKPLITHPIQAERASVKANNAFKDAVEKLNFTPYYPTYSSSAYPASSPKLNGYSNSPYTNETVTFLLGKAQVKQGTYLSGQDKIMNFADNCTIYQLWFSMENGTSIDQRYIDRILQHPQSCELISTTPSGKKVYFREDNQNAWFYVKLGQTNFIIEFDRINTVKYDPSQRDEILKIIDSLQPLEKTRLEDGNSYGHGFSS